MPLGTLNLIATAAPTRMAMADKMSPTRKPPNATAATLTEASAARVMAAIRVFEEMRAVIVRPSSPAPARARTGPRGRCRMNEGQLPTPPDDRRADLNRRLRQAFIEGAEEDSRRQLGARADRRGAGAGAATVSGRPGDGRRGPVGGPGTDPDRLTDGNAAGRPGTAYVLAT